MIIQIGHGKKRRSISVTAIFETALIITGLMAMVWLLPDRSFADGSSRYKALLLLLDKGQLSKIGYSLLGPLFALPFLIIDKLKGGHYWWVWEYNRFVFAAGLLAMYWLLKGRVERGVLRKFLLILTVASMFGNQVTFFGGEPFTAMCVAAGILAISFGPSLTGWAVVVIGVVNTPATLVGLICVVLKRILDKKRWRYVLAIAAAAALIALEGWIRRGSPFHTGYEGQSFSTPFFFGLLSILFAFGKGLLFFVPGLLLPIKRDLAALERVPAGGQGEWNASEPRANSGLEMSEQGDRVEERKSDGKGSLYGAYLLWISFIVGLVLIYSPWWAWDGAWFWGPRFFLFASIPASFALAVRLQRPAKSLLLNLLTLILLGISFCVGISGAAFDLNTLAVPCINDGRDYSHIILCQYVPNFSAIWHPFVMNQALSRGEVLFIVFSLVVVVYLAIPLLTEIIQQVMNFSKKRLIFWAWHF